MDTDALGPERAPFQRARLHIRAGRRRLRQGKISAGIITLYDALVSAMEWYVASPERMSKLKIRKGDNLKDEKNLFAALVRSGILDSMFDYEAFDRLVEKAAYEEMPVYHYKEMLKGIESLMTQFGIMPFDEKELPPEDPSTF